MESTALARTARRRGVARATARPSHTEGSERRSVVIWQRLLLLLLLQPQPLQRLVAQLVRERDSAARRHAFWNSTRRSRPRHRTGRRGARLADALLEGLLWMAPRGCHPFFHRRHVCERLNVPSQSVDTSVND